MRRPSVRRLEGIYEVVADERGQKRQTERGRNSVSKMGGTFVQAASSKGVPTFECLGRVLASLGQEDLVTTRVLGGEERHEKAPRALVSHCVARNDRAIKGTRAEARTSSMNLDTS